jgi:hypothetical protein
LFDKTLLIMSCTCNQEKLKNNFEYGWEIVLCELFTSYAVYKTSPPGPLSEGEGVCPSPSLRGGPGRGVSGAARENFSLRKYTFHPIDFISQIMK